MMEHGELFALIRDGRLDEAKAYIERSDRSPNAVDEEGVPATLRAMQTGDEAFCRWMVEYSLGKLDLTDAHGAAALHYAAERGSESLLRYLVERVGFDPLHGDGLGRTPFGIAHDHGNRSGEAYFEKAVGAKWDELYRNPIIPGFHPDPSIVRVGEDYYLVNSSFVWLPALPISHSRDLVHWETVGYVLTDENTAMLRGLVGGHGYWAPDISYHDGRFYVTATIRRNDGDPHSRAQIVTSAASIEGPWDEPAIIEENGIDPSLFTDVDGKRYMLLNRGARIIPLSDDARSKVGPAKLLWYGDMKRASEGPRIYLKDGWYYLLMAEGGTGLTHRISVARSRTLDGPYEPCPYDPILHQYDGAGYIQKAGHGDLVETPDGDWYCVYLCARPVDGMCPLGRETALDPVTWTADGWPIVNMRRGPSTVQLRPKLPTFVPRAESMDPASPRTMWASPRQSCEAKLENGTLFIKSDALDLDDIGARAGLFTRQLSLKCCFTAHIADAGDNVEAGVSAYYDELSFCKFGRRGGTLTFTRRSPGGWTELFSEKTGDRWLRIESDGLSRRFLSSADGENWTERHTIPRAGFMCDEGEGCGKRFTGSMLGLYAVGDGGTAAFDGISMR